MEKILYIKNIFENGWWEDALHIPHPTLLAVSYRNHQKSLTYFSHLAPLALFFFTKRQIPKGGGGMAQCSLPPTYAPDLIFISIFDITQITVRVVGLLLERTAQGKCNLPIRAITREAKFTQNSSNTYR